jgi:hypothetical protein
MRAIGWFNIQIIPHKDQRYNSAGDFWIDEDNALQIRISNLGDVRMNMLVLIHELVEVVLTENAGIPEPDIMAFDIGFEATRSLGNLDEPGDDVRAPYSKQHGIATGIERIVAAVLGVNWKEYEAACNAL